MRHRLSTPPNVRQERHWAHNRAVNEARGEITPRQAVLKLEPAVALALTEGCRSYGPIIQLYEASIVMLATEFGWDAATLWASVSGTLPGRAPIPLILTASMVLSICRLAVLVASDSWPKMTIWLDDLDPEPLWSDGQPTQSGLDIDGRMAGLNIVNWDSVFRRRVHRRFYK